MKKTILFSPILVGLFLLIGCADSNVPQNFSASLAGHSLTIGNDNLKFEAQGGSINTTVNTSNASWEFTNLPKWLDVSPKSGSSTTPVTFTAAENFSTDTTRASIFYLESKEIDWSYKTAISATQKAVEGYINPVATSLSFKGSKDSQTIGVVSNVKWQSASSASWIKAEASSDGKAITISVEANPFDVSRSAVVTLSSVNGVSSSINITQEPAGVTSSVETIEFEKEGGTKSTTISSEADWEAKTSESWITVSPLSGEAGNHDLTISVSENNSVAQRKGNVYVIIGSSAKLQIPVVQRGLYLEVRPSTLSFSADTESQQIDVNSNTDWKILSIPDWLSSNTQTGENSQTIVVTSNKNTSASSRNGKIKFGKEGLSLFTDVDVVQEGLNLSVDNNNLQFSDKASSQDLTISTITEWSVSTTDNWVHLSRTSGIGTSVIVVSVDENISEDSRTGQIKVIAGELSQTIAVIQQGKYFNISETDKTFTSKGGTIQISFSTNETWTASLAENVSWLSLSSTSGSGDGIINVTASDNASMKSRENAIIISPANSAKIKVSIKQAGRYLTVDCTELNFGQGGGTSELITISTDGSYKVTADKTWIKITNNSQNCFTVTTTENESKSRTGDIIIELTGLDNQESYQVNIKVIQEGNDIDGHEYVDLGLPSGTLWATCNLGASSPSDQGNMYAWGEPEPRTEFSSSTYIYSRPFVDAAEKKWSENWHIPTREQMEELVNSCEWKADFNTTLYGFYIYGPSGNYIYLPFCGSLWSDTFSRYWTCTLCTNNNDAYHLRFHGSSRDVISFMRYCGAAIRPVTKK